MNPDAIINERARAETSSLASSSGSGTRGPTALSRLDGGTRRDAGGATALGSVLEADVTVAKVKGRCGLQLAQIVLCKGCCCGRTDRNRPAVPIDELKALWKQEKLNTSIQLSISGCLGPCAMANVVMLMFPDRVVWLGPLTEGIDYAVLAGWARACHASGTVTPLPVLLQSRVFQRFDVG